MYRNAFKFISYIKPSSEKLQIVMLGHERLVHSPETGVGGMEAFHLVGPGV